MSFLCGPNGRSVQLIEHKYCKYSGLSLKITFGWLSPRVSSAEHCFQSFYLIVGTNMKSWRGVSADWLKIVNCWPTYRANRLFRCQTIDWQWSPCLLSRCSPLGLSGCPTKWLAFNKWQIWPQYGHQFIKGNIDWHFQWGSKWSRCVGHYDTILITIWKTKYKNNYKNKNL